MHGGSVRAGERVDGLPACCAVGEEGDGVVGRGVAVDGDGVEGAGNGMSEEGRKGGGWNWGVGAEDAEEGGHVGVDHPCAFGHAG